MGNSILQKDWSEIKAFFSEETKKHSLLRFFILILFIVGYFVYESYQLGAGQGFLVTILTWAFFLFCTPIADAGFVLAFPVRLLTNLRMIYTQIIGYVVGFFLVLFTMIYAPAVYSKNILLKLFYTILATPWPYWIIILLSAIGTFFSIYFGDELIDISKHKDRVKYHKHVNKYKIIVSLFVVAAAIALYYFLINQMGLKIPLF